MKSRGAESWRGIGARGKSFSAGGKRYSSPNQQSLGKRKIPGAFTDFG